MPYVFLDTSGNQSFFHVVIFIVAAIAILFLSWVHKRDYLLQLKEIYLLPRDDPERVFVLEELQILDNYCIDIDSTIQR